MTKDKMLPVLPPVYSGSTVDAEESVILKRDFDLWRDVLLHKAVVVYSSDNNLNSMTTNKFPDDTHMHLVLEGVLITSPTQGEVAVTELKRMHDCVKVSLLEATAFMGIPEHKRNKFIASSMENADYLLLKAVEKIKAAK